MNWLFTAAGTSEARIGRIRTPLSPGPPGLKTMTPLLCAPDAPSPPADRARGGVAIVQRDPHRAALVARDLRARRPRDGPARWRAAAPAAAPGTATSNESATTTQAARTWSRPRPLPGMRLSCSGARSPCPPSPTAPTSTARTAAHASRAAVRPARPSPTAGRTSGPVRAMRRAGPPFRDVAIAGVSNTVQARTLPGPRFDVHCAGRGLGALADAGIPPHEVDGVVGTDCAQIGLELGLGPCTRRPARWASRRCSMPPP